MKKARNLANSTLIKFENYPSIRTLEQNSNITGAVTFQSVVVNYIKQFMKNLQSNK